MFPWKRRKMYYSMWVNKGNPGLTPNFSKSKKKKDIIKLISVHDSIINLLSVWYIVHSYSAMDGCTAINLANHVKIAFWPSWHCLRCMMAFAGAFTTNNNNSKTFISRTHCPRDTRGAQLLKNYYMIIFIYNTIIMNESFEINDNGN